MTEHEAKYEALAQKLGVEALIQLMPVGCERVKEALAAGDEHLNTIALSMWDGAAFGHASGPRPALQRSASEAPRACPTCGQTVRRSPVLHGPDWPGQPLRETARNEPWCRATGLSLAERVCALKHVAKYHYLGLVPA